MDKATELLATTRLPMATIAERTGFASPARFSSPSAALRLQSDGLAGGDRSIVGVVRDLRFDPVGIRLGDDGLDVVA